MKIHPSPDEAIRLSRHFSQIPVVLEVSAPHEDPVSLYARVCPDHGSFLLEKSRFAWIGERPSRILFSQGGRLRLRDERGRVNRLPETDPFAWLEAELKKNRAPNLPGLPPLLGGAAGCFGYETVRFLEPNRPVTKDPAADPGIRLMWFDRMIVYDRIRKTALFVGHLGVPAGGGETDIRRQYDSVVRQLRAWASDWLHQPLVLPQPETGKEADRKTEEFAGWSADLDREAFACLVRRAKERIAAGDIFQVVLSRSWMRRTPVRPLDLYRVLARTNPSPYLFLMETGDEALVGASPETLVNVSGNAAEVHPIAGTRPRGRTPEEDARLVRELLADEKEQAEHVMLVDLARNDLGRVAVPGTVRVAAWKEAERYSRVTHLVSRVEARLDERTGALEAFRACFPAGTVTGAPKVKAMEIIAVAEPSARGFYAGAGALFGFSGELDSWIMIRTAHFRNGAVHIRAGAGIVADSDPQREAEETENKAAALARGVRLAENITVKEGSR